MSKAEYAVVIGRFQPYHLGHHALIKRALELAEQVIVVIGSAYAARSAKNPFTYPERVKMIRGSFDDEYTFSDKIHFVGVSDFFYNESRWFDTVRIKVQNIVGNSQNIVLVGHSKDHSSYYVTRFQGWTYREVGVQAGGVNATDLREHLFTDDLEDAVLPALPSGTVNVINEFINTEAYEDIRDEWRELDAYKKSWSSAPFPPIFVTTDAVIHKSGYILLVKRRNVPGKGLWALPGGFIGEHETLVDSCLREVYEESGIRILPTILQAHVREHKTFDYPYRSLRGRAITHAFLIDLGEGLLPPVQGGDDAVDAQWFTTTELFMMQDQMFEDHFSIIQYFIAKL